jgi:rubrerythrin
MEWALSMDELREYAARYKDMAERAEAEGNSALAREFRDIASDAERHLNVKPRSAA